MNFKRKNNHTCPRGKTRRAMLLKKWGKGATKANKFSVLARRMKVRCG